MYYFMLYSVATIQYCHRSLSQNTTNTSSLYGQPLPAKLLINRQYSILSLQKHVYGFWDLLTSFDVLDFDKVSRVRGNWTFRHEEIFSQISNFVQENLGLMSAVVESIWVVIRSNLNVVLTLLTGIFSAIMGGGTVVLNFIVSLVILLQFVFLKCILLFVSLKCSDHIPLGSLLSTVVQQRTLFTHGSNCGPHAKWG